MTDSSADAARIVAASSPALVGVVVPSSNAVLEEDLRALLGADFAVLGARVGSGTQLSHEVLTAMASESRREVGKLAHAEPLAIAYGCTSGSFFAGPGYDRQLQDELESSSEGIPVITATGAAVAGLRSLGADRIGFASPYPEAVHELGCRYFADEGFAIAADACLGVADNHRIAALDHATVERLVADVCARGIDAVFLSCTGLPSAAHLDRIRSAAGVPVLTSNLALANAIAACVEQEPRP